MNNIIQLPEGPWGEGGLHGDPTGPIDYFKD